MRAVQIDEFGGPEVLKVVDLPVPEPAEGEVLVRVARAGMNFADTHQRENSYIARYELPLVLGGEVAGTDADGRQVVSLLRSGGYAEHAVAPADQTFAIPDGVDDGAALALLIQGLTAWHLYRTSAKLGVADARVDLLEEKLNATAERLRHLEGEAVRMTHQELVLIERVRRGIQGMVRTVRWANPLRLVRRVRGAGRPPEAAAAT